MALDHRWARNPAPFVATRSDDDVYSWNETAAFRPRNRSRSPAGDELMLRGQAARTRRSSVIAVTSSGIAHTLQRRSLGLILETLGARDLRTIAMMVRMRDLWFNEGRHLEVGPLALQIVQITTDIHGLMHPDTLTAKYNLANSWRRGGRWRECGPLLVQIHDQRKEILGEKAKPTMDTLNILGIIWRDMGQYKKAQDVHTKVVQIHGEPSISRLGQFRYAETARTAVLELCRELYGPHHPNTITAVANLAVTLTKLGRHEEVEKAEVEVLERRKGLLGPRHLETILAMAHLAFTQIQLGRYADGEKAEAEVLELRREVLGPTHPDSIRAMANLAVTWNKMGRHAEAEKAATEVLELRKELLGEAHPDTIPAMANLACMKHKLGLYAEAEEAEMEILELRKDILGESHPDTIHVMSNLAQTWHEQGKYNRSETLLAQAVELSKGTLGPWNPDTITREMKLEKMKARRDTRERGWASDGDTKGEEYDGLGADTECNGTGKESGNREEGDDARPRLVSANVRILLDFTTTAHTTLSGCLTSTGIGPSLEEPVFDLQHITPTLGNEHIDSIDY